MVDLDKLAALTGDELREALTARDLLTQLEADDMVVAIAYDPYARTWLCNLGTHRHLEADGAGHQQGPTMDLAIFAAATAAGYTPGE